MVSARIAAPSPATAGENATPAQSSTAPKLEAIGKDMPNSQAPAAVGSASTFPDTVQVFSNLRYCASYVVLAAILVTFVRVGVYTPDDAEISATLPTELAARPITVSPADVLILASVTALAANLAVVIEPSATDDASEGT